MAQRDNEAAAGELGDGLAGEVRGAVGEMLEGVVQRHGVGSPVVSGFGVVGRRFNPVGIQVDVMVVGHVKAEEERGFEYPGGVRLPPVHPGRMLASELAARGLTVNALALKLRVPANRLTDIVRGNRAVLPETAMRLGRYFRTGAQFWMKLQLNYELALAEQRGVKIVKRQVELTR